MHIIGVERNGDEKPFGRQLEIQDSSSEVGLDKQSLGTDGCHTDS